MDILRDGAPIPSPARGRGRTANARIGVEELIPLKQISTSLLERLNGTIRQHVAPLHRKTRSFAKCRTALETQIRLFKSYDNLCRKHGTLKARHLRKLRVPPNALGRSVPGQKSSPVFSPDGNQIAFIWDGGENLQRGVYVKLIGEGSPLGVASNPGFQLAWSPDKKMLAVASRNSPQESSSLVLVTLNTGSPRWSSDGRQIVFDSRPAGLSSIYVISAAGGSPRQLTDGKSENVLPSWLRDDRWIYFGSRRNGDWQIWRMTATGEQAEQVTKNGGYEAVEAADGKTLYYAKE